MSVEVRPLGVNCNIGCQYCYQNPIKDAGNTTKQYDMEAIKASIRAEGKPFAMFGGEPLLVPEDDLEELFALGFALHGGNTIQTNGTLINERHLDMFKKYKVRVGISVDGPGELNDVRWMGNQERTRAGTAHTEAAIQQLLERQIPVSIIVTLHQRNANAQALPTMNQWLKKLAQQGLHHVRLHVLEVDHDAIREAYALSPEENLHAFMNFAALEAELPQGFLDVFEDIRHMMEGNDTKASCVWRACDPYATDAVHGIEGNGQRTNCGRTNKDGIDFRKANRPGLERYFALYHTPQAYGGCQGCRFFLMCKGQCPGTSIHGDWRHRSENCDTWKALFTYFEQKLVAQGKVPLSQHPQREAIEQHVVSAYGMGQNPTVESAMQEVLS